MNAKKFCNSRILASALLGAALMLGANTEKASAKPNQEEERVRPGSTMERLLDRDRLSEHFRSGHLEPNVVEVPRAARIQPIPIELCADPIPEAFDFFGQNIASEPFLSLTDTTGLAILHRGQLVFERYGDGYGPQTTSIQMSVAKTFVGFLTIVALRQGAIGSPNDLVTQYLPQFHGTAYDGVRIIDLLDMSSGIRWREDVSDPQSELVRSIIVADTGSLDEFALTMVRENTPGEFHRYATIDSHVLAMVLRKATGKTYPELFRDEVWQKIGAEGSAFFSTDAAGQAKAHGGLSISLRDMLRFGHIYANRGRNLAGEQLISEEWIDKSTVPDHPRLEPGPDNPLSSSYFGYKHHWWVPDGYDRDFAAIGIFGQFIYVNRNADLVIAKTSAYRDFMLDGGVRTHQTIKLFQAIAQHFIAGRACPGR